jgi:hypothetical protein
MEAGSSSYVWSIVETVGLLDAVEKKTRKLSHGNMAEGLTSDHKLTRLDWALRAICVALFVIFVVAPILISAGDEGWGDLMMLIYAVLSPVSAILVFLDRKRRATSMFWVPAVLFFCALALPGYMFARRRAKKLRGGNNQSMAQT